jgi:hypothetical protein
MNIVPGIDANSSLIQWFWDVMEEFTNQERSLFLRFVWGRTRLPRTIADFRGRDFVLQVSVICKACAEEPGELWCERKLQSFSPCEALKWCLACPANYNKLSTSPCYFCATLLLDL